MFVLRQRGFSCGHGLAVVAKQRCTIFVAPVCDHQIGFLNALSVQITLDTAFSAHHGSRCRRNAFFDQCFEYAGAGYRYLSEPLLGQGRYALKHQFLHVSSVAAVLAQTDPEF